MVAVPVVCTACTLGEDPREDLEHAGQISLCRPRDPPKQLDEVAEEKEVWVSLVKLMRPTGSDTTPRSTWGATGDCPISLPLHPLYG